MSKNFTLDLQSNSFKKLKSTCRKKGNFARDIIPRKKSLDFILSYAASKRILKYKGKSEFHFTLN